MSLPIGHCKDSNRCAGKVWPSSHRGLNDTVSLQLGRTSSITYFSLLVFTRVCYKHYSLCDFNEDIHRRKNLNVSLKTPCVAKRDIPSPRLVKQRRCYYLSHLNSNILCIQVRSPWKWVCYPHGPLLLVWWYYISHSQVLTAHAEVFRRKKHHHDCSNVATALPSFAICVRCSSPLAKQGIFLSNVFTSVMVILAHCCPDTSSKTPERNIPRSAMQRQSVSFLTTPECCSPPHNPIAITAQRILYDTPA